MSSGESGASSPSSRSRSDCLAAADALYGAAMIVDDLDAASTLCRLSDQWRDEAATTDPGVWAEVQAERERAHAKHGDTSMEAQPPTAWLRLAILMEEVGEVAKVYNDARHRAQAMGWDEADMFSDPAEAELRAELVQVAAMAGAWADALTVRSSASSDSGRSS